MIVTLDEVLDESEKYVRKMADEKRYGDKLSDRWHTSQNTEF